jgi:starch phosphorylase
MRTLKYAHSFEVFRELPEAVAPLKELAYNLRWTWDHDTLALFHDLDVEMWHECDHNPVELLNRVPLSRLEALANDEIYMARLTKCAGDLADYMSASTWFDEHYPGERESTQIAYFCFEFGIHECLPIYSGGLGVLAGDHLKAASDLGIPLVAIGLLYSRGYFRQSLTPDGWQLENYPEYDFYRMPLTLVRDASGQPTRIEVEFPDRNVTCQIWKAQVGRVELYLLDSNVLENAPGDQTITDSLYSGDQEMRIRQESILGVGGYRALTRLGKRPTVCHMNEGHAAFLSIERLRQFMAEHQCDLRLARKAVVAGNVFTTHTPVPAGFDIFERGLLERYMGKQLDQLQMPFEQFLRLGRIKKENPGENLNMAVLAMEMSNYVNGVSKLHAAVTREMFHERWPDYPLNDIPIDAVTNGIHTMSFLSPRMARLLDKHLGPEWRNDPSERKMWERVSEIPDRELWDMRENARGDFVRFCRRHLRNRMKVHGNSTYEISGVADVLDPRALTIGFARRFATYKRATLLFRDPERLKALMMHKERPVQFVFAGKAHPRDDGGKKLIQDITHFMRDQGVRTRLVFLEDYDINVARQMVQGVDVWLNNPRRPQEASGTSGMKVVPNGGLNVSILDGWWAEGYKRGVGWAIGDDHPSSDEGYQDWLDSQNLYQLIENEIAPTFYHRTDTGVPTAWVELMKKSMADLAPTYSTLRMLREYTSRFYMPASHAFTRLSGSNLKHAEAALGWRDRVQAAWHMVRVQSVRDSAGSAHRVDSSFEITARVSLGNLKPEDVKVQALVGRVSANRELTDLEVHDLELREEADGAYTFVGTAQSRGTGHGGYVVRVVPFHEDVRVPSEIELVAWEPVE